jgi:hypothetical protein
MDIVTLLDGLLAQYPSIGIVSTEDYYAVPLKYTKENGVVKLYVDRDMMVPVMDVLAPLLGALGPDTTMGIDLGQVLKDRTSQIAGGDCGMQIAGLLPRKGTRFFVFAESFAIFVHRPGYSGILIGNLVRRL